MARTLQIRRPLPLGKMPHVMRSPSSQERPLSQAVHVSSWSSGGGSPCLLLDLELGPHDVSLLKFQIHIFTVIFTTIS